ncbi:hypothetical protein [Lysinibacillus sphaericus]|uniref:hypothetical protein n=1 Tax=Lysinibacillus sphaericus TaxID=1421 RepID=UPI001CBE4100|nr:hypothetical protein [Lysinibacillus sphaericus]
MFFARKRSGSGKCFLCESVVLTQRQQQMFFARKRSGSGKCFFVRKRSANAAAPMQVS